MFGDWPDDRLFQLFQRPHPDAPARGAMLLTPRSTAPVDLAIRSTFGVYGRVRRAFGTRPHLESDGLNNSVPRGRALSPKQRAYLVLNAVNDIAPIQLTPRVRREARAFEPAVIHSLLGGVRTMRLTLALSRFLELPIVPHFMDDWIANLFNQGQLGGRARSETEKVFGLIMDRSPVCLTIGSDMNAEFERRLGRPCVVVGNSVDLSDYSSAPAPPPAPGSPLTLSYIGGLHLGRDAVIERLMEAFENSGSSREQWVLRLFVPAEDEGRANRLAATFPRRATYMGNLPPERVPDQLCSSDALLFLESSDPGLLSFTRLSVSTKVPQYLASGRPMLIIGPTEQGSVRELRRSPIAVYPGHEPTSADFASALLKLADLVRSPQPTIGQDTPFDQAAFGSTATQERLRLGLHQASTTRVRDIRPATTAPLFG